MDKNTKYTSKRTEYDTYDGLASMKDALFQLEILECKLIFDKTHIEQQLKKIREVMEQYRNLQEQFKNIFHDPED